MALRSSRRRTQDQNFSFHDGVKTSGSIAQKHRGVLGGRKALNDISNAGKPSALQPSRKHNTVNVIPIGEDLGVSKKSQIGGSGRKALSDLTNSVKPNKRTQGKKRTNGSIAQKNSQIGVSGRKALSDLTNSVKPKKTTQGKQTVTVVAEDEDEDENFPCSIAEEGFLHNHDECIKSQKKLMDLDQFLEINGLLDEGNKSVCFQSISGQSKEENPNLWPTSPVFFSETPEPIILHRRRPRLSQTSPICGSPISPWQPSFMKEVEIW